MKFEFGFILLISLLRSGFGIKVYQTCRDIKSSNTGAVDLADGYYFIQLQNGVAIQVYCTGMAPNSATQPAEYIDLPSGRTRNYGKFYKYVGKAYLGKHDNTLANTVNDLIYKIFFVY